MPYHTEIFFSYLMDFLAERNIKYDIYDFPSGCMMIDVWYKNDFYMVYLEPNSAGLSSINPDNPGFNSIPDEVFTELENFKRRFEMVFV